MFIMNLIHIFVINLYCNIITSNQQPGIFYTEYNNHTNNDYLYHYNLIIINMLGKFKY